MGWQDSMISDNIARPAARLNDGQTSKAHGGMKLENLLHDLSWVLPLRSPELTPIFKAFTWLGYTNFFLILLPIIYWLWDRDRGTRVALLVFITALSNSLLKDIFQDPRPDIAFALDPEVGASFGRPSGHAQIAFAMWLWLALEIGRIWAWAAAIFIALGVSFSRLYLGVHDVDDVLVGSTIGIATVILYRWTLTPSFDAWRRLPGSTYLLILIGIGAVSFLLWPAQGESGRSALQVTGLMFGWWTGVLLDRRLSPLRAKPAGWWAWPIIGVGGTWVLLQMPGALAAGAQALALPELPAAIGISAILGFYMTGFAPLVFRMLRLIR